MTAVTGTGVAVTGLGGPAGFGEIMLSRADDASLRVDVGAVFENGFQLGTQLYASDDLFVSTNGLVSFGGAVNGVVSQLSAINHPFIAAFHADVDTRLDGEGAESGPVWVDVDPIADVVTITWQEVGFYRRNASYTNTFQLQLYDQGADGISIVLRYDTIRWTTGDLQGGWQGLGGAPALIGWRLAASGAINGHGASGDEARLLALAGTNGNTGVQGLWVYDFAPPKVAHGSSANDVLCGDPGDDLLYGGTGDDRLIGLTGADAFFGGSGFDLVDYALSATAVTVNLADPRDNRGAEALGDSYSSIEGVVGSAFDDRITGDALDNRLEGGGGNDWLSDGAGNDTILGGVGNDTLLAGAGADHYHGGTGSDSVDYARAPAGIRLDLVNPGGSTGIAAGDRFSSIETFLATGWADTLAGGAGQNRFFGMGGADVLLGRAGADRLHGGAGADTLAGGAGGDLLFGGSGFDTASYTLSSAAVTVHLAFPQRSRGGEAEGDRLSGIEGLLGSRFSDSLSGNAAANRLSGAGGNDRLSGGAGADTLIGGTGNDLLEGGRDGDTLLGGAGRDTASYAVATSSVTAHLARPSLNRGEAVADRYSGIEDLIGSRFRDMLSGNAGANRINGGRGNDTLQGGQGADWLQGAEGFDLASYAGSAAGLLVNLARPSLNTLEAAGDRFSGIEGLLGSRFGDTLSGDHLANLLYGAGGADQLCGGLGDDTLEGGAGADFLQGNAGVDLASYARSTSAVYARLSDPRSNLGDARADRYEDIEGLIGSSHADTLFGSKGEDWLYGGQGADSLAGGWGHDRLFGGDGNDTLSGGASADTLEGGAGFDWASYTSNLVGLTASLATPALNTGDAAADHFISIEGLRGSYHDDRLYGDDSDNRLDGESGNDLLFAAAGADTLDGGAGIDSLTGGSGADTFVLVATAGAGDLITDYDPTVGDSLQITIPGLSRPDIQLQTQSIAGIGAPDRAEIVILHQPSGQVLFTLQDAAGLTDIFLRIGATLYDLL